MPDPTGRVSHLPNFHRGESWKQPCRVATTANVTIATALNAGDTIDGVVLAALDRVLVKDQTAGAENGIYYAGVTPARDYDMDQDGATTVTASEVMGALVYVIAGTANAGKLYRNTNTTAPTLGTTALTFVEFTSGGGTITVTEPDGTSIASVDTLRFPNGTLTDLGGGDVDVRQVPTGFIGARAYNTAAVSVASGGSGTIITLDSERYDSDAYHSTSANTGRMTVPAGMGGKHHLSGNVRFASSALGERRLELLLNGTTVIAAQSEQGVIAAAVSIMVSTTYDLAATDYVEMRAFQDSGGALNVEAASAFTPEFTATKLDAGRVGSGVGVQAVHNTTQTLTTATDTALALAGTDEFDTDAFHNPAVNNTRVTIPAGLGGIYLLIGQTGFAANATGVRQLYFRKNGTTAVGGTTITVPTAAAYIAPIVSATLSLVAGDYIELMGYQDSGGNLNASSSVVSRLSIARLDSDPAIASGTATGIEHVDEGAGTVIGTTATDIAGATLTITPTQTETWVVMADYDFDWTTASAGNLGVGTLSYSGAGTVNVKDIVLSGYAISRTTICQVGRITGVTAAAHTIKLTALKTGAGGVLTTSGVSRLVVLRYAA